MVFTACAVASLLHCPQVNAEADTGTRSSLRLIVRTAAAGLGGILESVEGREEQIQVIDAFIQPVRFFSDLSGYFFVYDITGVCVAHATQPNLVGKSLSNMQDQHGTFVIRAFIAHIRNGGGYVEYNWEKPGSATKQDKLGYAAPIPGTNFFIGSGIYFSNLR